MVVVSDVLIHILSKLSPESLLRFNSVCKSWYALINDPKFVTKHLLDSFSHKHVLLQRIITNNSGKKEHVFSILEFSLDRSVSSVYDVPLPFHEGPRPCLSYLILPDLDVRGHSHGLICLSDHNRDIFLCNPMTRQCRKLPPTILVIPEPEGRVSLRLGVVGFGYDVKCRDFKVVKVVSLRRGFVRYPSRVEIYDLRKDRWREIKTLVDVNFLCHPSFDMYHEGTFYWLGIHLPSGKKAILTFDMSKEDIKPMIKFLIFGRWRLMEFRGQNY
ncbi:putative F-box/LRR-repeat/kelch-repeat protein [Cucumis melo var. makuwa]|uniref:Putative F-box/LRR-repeat/kelch-repeat protein n=1 Tax=Cucumis melo var. makuwa TaxID=1194695 RepID=A0A5D3DN99_CUCMM|nr:putative F-box/LRR-repeat/kelch-repeat protein [Cucumis melo var. makuwa]